MIFTAVHSNPASCPRRQRAFTLVEIIITLGVASIFMTVLMSSFVFMGRSSMALGNYQEFSQQGRHFLEVFGRDCRMTRDVLALSSTGITMSVQFPDGVRTVIYSYNSNTGDLNRTEDGVSRTVLFDVIDVDFTFFNITGTETTQLLEVKALELRAVMERTLLRLVNTEQIISARFTMRNRRVST